MNFSKLVFVRIGWKFLPGTNTLAYYEISELHTKNFITLAPGVNLIKHFWSKFTHSFM
jgi:hypothetical protein